MTVAAKTAERQRAKPTAAASSPQPTALLAWYDRHRRKLPWRAPPGERADPYRVWLSEIMLQQTTVKAVGPYYARFLARWPDIRALAAAPLEEVLKTWAGLGYYARARNLHACARAVVERHGGQIPASEEDLRDLPGIGAYTAAAIAAIAFDAPATPVDGNIERVIARLYALDVAAAGGEAGNFPVGAGFDAAAAHRRFRPSHDGSRRHHLHAEESRLRALSLEQKLRGIRARRCRDVSAARAEAGRGVAPWRCFCCASRRRFCAAAHAADEGSTWRHD